MNRRKDRSSSSQGNAGVPVPMGRKVIGAAQMSAGTALAIAGIPLCVLPGPGIAAIAGGAALASKGQRNFSGRAATRLEERLDSTAEKMSAAAKEQAAKAARVAARKAPEVAHTVAVAAGRGLVGAAKAGGSLAANAVRAARMRARG